MNLRSAHGPSGVTLLPLKRQIWPRLEAHFVCRPVRWSLCINSVQQSWEQRFLWTVEGHMPHWCFSVFKNNNKKQTFGTITHIFVQEIKTTTFIQVIVNCTKSPLDSSIQQPDALTWKWWKSNYWSNDTSTLSWVFVLSKSGGSIFSINLFNCLEGETFNRTNAKLFISFYFLIV